MKRAGPARYTLAQAVLERGMIRVSFDITPEQFVQLLAEMKGQVKIRGRGRSSRTMLERDDVLKMVPISKSTLKRKLADGSFPAGKMISPKRHIWYEDEILEWLDSLEGPLPPTRSKPPRKPVAKKKRARR
jgi:predicted DNA-binding transcriptional regulator AlpA